MQVQPYCLQALREGLFELSEESLVQHDVWIRELGHMRRNLALRVGEDSVTNVAAGHLEEFELDRGPMAFRGNACVPFG